MKRCALAWSIVAALSGCTVGPDYRRPETSAPAAWRLGNSDAVAISDAAWWEEFHDPALTGLVRKAIGGNKDLAIATAHVEEAFAQYGITRSALFPQLDAGTSATKRRLSESGPAPITTEHSALDDYDLHLSASFELDLWGRLRRANEAARAGLLGSEEGRRTVVLTLVTSVANGYILLRALDRQLDIARRTSASLREAERLQRARFDEGAVPESDYRQAQSQYEAAAAQVPELERLIARQENFIGVLVGGNPGPITRGREIDALAFPALPEALPSELLERRPDIRQAEQNLIAANADIGVARAAYFPRISLVGLLGIESGELSSLFKGPSRTWSYGVGASLPIFNAGRVRGQVTQSEAFQREALFAYEKSIIVAFQEVEDAIVDRSKFAQVRESRARNLVALERFRDLADLRYREGATIYLEVANAEQSLFNAQLAYVATESQLFQSYVNLYKTMGGGWVAKAQTLAKSE